jgi:hypothetical protein
MSGACAYAVSTRCCAACRERALELSGLPSPGACATEHRSFQRVRPEERNEFFRPLLACVVLRAVASASVEALLFGSPLFWYVTFEDLNQPICTTVSMLSGSFVSPVRHQFSMPLMIMQRMSAAVSFSFRCPCRWIRNRWRHGPRAWQRYRWGTVPISLH